MSRRRTGPRTPHERTELPEVQRADEAYAGRAEHTPTGNERRDPGLRLCGMRDHRQPHRAWLARWVGKGDCFRRRHHRVRCAGDGRSRFHDPIEPTDFANMRANGVRSLDPPF
jgi:hypothetical protein